MIKLSSDRIDRGELVKLLPERFVEKYDEFVPEELLDRVNQERLIDIELLQDSWAIS